MKRYVLLQTKSLTNLSGRVPSKCASHLEWAFDKGKNEYPENYSNMINTCGVASDQATLNDFQRLFKCKSIQKADCNDQGLEFPASCSCPPCNECTPSCQGKF